MNTTSKFEFLPLDGQPINYKGMEKSSYLGPIIGPMVHCMQNIIFHSERDVWSHTKLCLENLLISQTYKEATNVEKEILFLSVLLHDAGKPLCTKEDDEGITSKGHSIKGARLARESIIKWNSEGITQIPFESREQICNMILLHMLPVYLLEKEDPLHSVAASSMVLKNKLLSALSIADIEGRLCDIKYKERAIERVQLFDMFCEENKCHTSKKSFSSDRARFRYLFEHKGHPDYDYYEPINGKVIIMCGLQASGKDFIIKKKYSNLDMVSLDQTRLDMDLEFGDDEGMVIQQAKIQCKQLMRQKKDFVFNATNIIKDIRTRWINLFRQYNYHITINYVERPLNIMLDSNKKRDKPVPEDIILDKVKKIDIPTLLECHELILDV